MRKARALKGQGGFILRHVITIGIAVVVIGFLIVEIGPIVWLRFSTIQDAEDLANAAAFQYNMNQSMDRAEAEAKAQLPSMGYSPEEIQECEIKFFPPGSSPTEVEATVVKYANGLLIRHIEQLKKLSRVATTREASLVAPPTGQQ